MLKYYCKRIRAGLIFALLIFILDVLYCDKTRGKNSVSLSGIFDNGVFDPRGEKFWLCIVWKYATYLGHTKPVSPGNLCSSYRDGVWGSRFFFTWMWRKEREIEREWRLIVCTLDHLLQNFLTVYWSACKPPVFRNIVQVASSVAVKLCLCSLQSVWWCIEPFLIDSHTCAFSQMGVVLHVCVCVCSMYLITRCLPSYHVAL